MEGKEWTLTYPIYIPSKGRPTGKTFKLLTEEGIKFVVVIEMQDYDTYKKHLTDVNYVVLPEQDRGIAYARNFAMDHAVSMGRDWIWLLDDDISAFYETVNGKNVKRTPQEALSGAEKMIDKVPNCLEASLEYQQFAWAAKKPYTLNTRCDVVVALRVGKMDNIRCSEDLRFKVDRDLTLKILQRGYRTLRINSFSFAAPKNGSNKGGLYDEYHTDGVEEHASKTMASKWPGICKFNRKKDGRPDVKINWRIFSGN